MNGISSLAHLHPGLNHINWSVAKHTSSSCSCATQCCLHSTNVLGVVITLDPVLEVLVDKKSDHLVRALLKYGRCKALVCASDTC